MSLGVDNANKKMDALLRSAQLCRDFSLGVYLQENFCAIQPLVTEEIFAGLHAAEEKCASLLPQIAPSVESFVRVARLVGGHVAGGVNAVDVHVGDLERVRPRWTGFVTAVVGARLCNGFFVQPFRPCRHDGFISLGGGVAICSGVDGLQLLNESGGICGAMCFGRCGAARIPSRLTGGRIRSPEGHHQDAQHDKAEQRQPQPQEYCVHGKHFLLQSKHHNSYTAPVTSKKGVIGIGVPLNRCDESRSFLRRNPAASLSMPPVLAARTGGRKAHRFAQAVPCTPTRSSCRPQLALGAAVVANRTAWRPLMAQSEFLGAPAPVLAVVDGIPTTTSLEVARHFNRPHDEVLRRIRNLVGQLDGEHLRNFAEVFHEAKGGNGAMVKYPAYRITRDGFTLLAMGFTGKKALAFKLAYIDAFNRMEAALYAPAELSEGRRGQLLCAMEMAGAVASRVQNQMFDQLAHGADPDAVQHSRWLVRVDHCGTPQVREVAADAVVGNYATVIRNIGDPGSMVSPDILSALADACLKALVRACDRKKGLV